MIQKGKIKYVKCYCNQHRGFFVTSEFEVAYTVVVISFNRLLGDEAPTIEERKKMKVFNGTEKLK